MDYGTVHHYDNSLPFKLYILTLELHNSINITSSRENVFLISDSENVV